MSEVKAEEPPVVVEAPKVVGAPALVETPAPLAEGSAAPATTGETAAEVNEEVKEEEAKVEPTEVKAITEGWLEFKPHGILHFISTRRYFYLQDEPVEADNLQTYLKKEKKEKPEAAHSTVAYASQTGKGLLFFAKTDVQKAHPIGIIKLSDVAEVTSAGANKFTLKLTSDVWNFEAPNTAERDGWVHTLKAKVAEAKDSIEAVTNSEGYKAALEKFSKKPVVGKSETAKEKEKEKEEDKKDEEEEKEEKKEDEKEKKEKKKEKKEKKKEEGTKSDDSSDSSDSEDEGSSDKKGKKTKRSNSVKGKRTSFFDLLGNKNKKQEKEERKEEKVEEKKEEEPKAGEAQAAGEGSSEVPAPVGAEEAKAVEEPKPVEEASKPVESPPVAEGVTTPKGGNKRHSFFGFFDKKKEAEKKDIEPRETVSDTPPVIAPIGEEQKETETEEVKPVETAAPAPVETTKSPSSPPKESFLDKLFKPKDKTPAPTAAAPAPETEVKKEDVVETKPEDTETAKEGEAIKETDEKVPEAASPKDTKRRSSFFTLGKKDKKPTDVKSDTEEESTSKSNPTPKKLNLFRKNSKSAKDAPKADSEEVPPVPEVAPVVPATTETSAAATHETPASVEETAPTATQTTDPTVTTPATTA